MPSQIHKKPIAGEMKKSLPQDIKDLMLGADASQPGLLSTLYGLIERTSAAIELAYRRGYQAGLEAEKGR